MLENKVSELEKRLNELEEENKATRKLLDELIYHFMNEIGTGIVTGTSYDHEHVMIPRNVKKAMLDSIRYTHSTDTEEIIFGKNYYEKLELRKYEMHERTEKLEGIIEEMTEEECEKRLNKVFQAEVKKFIERAGEDPEHIKKNLERLIKHEPSLLLNLLTVITRSSEGLWPIFDKIREKKELEIDQFREEFMKPYLERYEEINLMIEKQKETEKLAIIKEKEAELKRLKKDFNAE